jgi:hypothetical protein
MPATGSAAISIDPTAGAQLTQTMTAPLADIFAAIAKAGGELFTVEIANVPGWQLQVNCIPAPDPAPAPAP